MDWPTTTALIGVLSWLVGVWVGHRLDLGRGRTLKQEADIKSEQVVFLPLIETAMRATAKDQPLDIWRKQGSGIKAAASRFQVFLTNGKRKAFDRAWLPLETMKENDLLSSSGQWFVDGQGAEFVASQKALIDKLGHLYEAVEKA